MISLQDLFGDDYDQTDIVERLAPAEDLDPDLGQFSIRGSLALPKVSVSTRGSVSAKTKAKTKAKTGSSPFTALSQLQARLKAAQQSAAKAAAKAKAKPKPKPKAKPKPKPKTGQFWTPATLAAKTGAPVRVTASAKGARRLGATATKAPTMASAARQREVQAVVDRFKQRERELLSRGVVGPALPSVDTIKACAPGAYRQMACCGPLGGSAAARLLDKIIAELELAATQREATYEHDVLSNTGAYRRKVLDYLRQLSLR